MHDFDVMVLGGGSAGSSAARAAVDACKTRLDKIPTIIKRFRQTVLADATSGRLTEEWRSSSRTGSVIRVAAATLYFSFRHYSDLYPKCWASPTQERSSDHW